MKISEIFYSIQGEGKNAGMPAVFLRLAECNLRCVWCDTDYTWNWEKYNREKESRELAVEQVLEEVRRHPCRNLVMTGGEPLLQQKELVQLMSKLKSGGYWLEVETNATLLPAKEFDDLVDQYNCSPKLKNSGHRTEEMEKPKALKFFGASPKAVFKFVIAGPACHREADRFIEKYGIPREKVWLMPEGKTSAAVREKLRRLTPFCLERGFQLSDRLHLHLFGNRRGT
ncbi:MAG: 7-carboxy-7-deazaguanine synthase QueE [Deltaproteobacteria bacterium]|nr:7-carboxy-7-deazaguanine synthase QueE [Deltaproteobacteria bacterium]MBI4223642.1 7-carboxy-7-deazaguanine synthase QueE [Deltaproteobacteria bacterium]